MPTAAPGAGWTPFRPSAADLERISHDVAPISDLQARLVDAHPDLALRDRVAHQCQIAGGRVQLEVTAEMAPPLAGIGLFQPGAVHTGIGRAGLRRVVGAYLQIRFSLRRFPCASQSQIWEANANLDFS